MFWPFTNVVFLTAGMLVGSCDLRARAMALVRERYADFGPTLACEKLRECHGIALAKETVRRWMRDAGLWIPRAQRPPKVYQPRARRACLGELIPRNASSSTVGTCTGDRSPARGARTSFAASRRSVLTRSPGFRGISDGAQTMQWYPFAVNWR